MVFKIGYIYVVRGKNVGICSWRGVLVYEVENDEFYYEKVRVVIICI